MTDFTEAYLEAVASAPAGEIIYNTIEIRHDSFSDENGDQQSIYLVRDYQDLEATLEDTHPFQASETVTFQKMAFDFTPPGKESGVVPQMTIDIDNVSAELNEYLDLASSEETPITVIYRQYLKSDLTEPATTPVALEVLTCNLDLCRVSVTCQMTNISTRNVPNIEYTSANFPNLVS